MQTFFNLFPVTPGFGPLSDSRPRSSSSAGDLGNTLMIAEQAGNCALLTHLIDAAAAAFYQRFGFVPSPVPPNFHLFPIFPESIESPLGSQLNSLIFEAAAGSSRSGFEPVGADPNLPGPPRSSQPYRRWRRRYRSTRTVTRSESIVGAL